MKWIKITKESIANAPFMKILKMATKELDNRVSFLEETKEKLEEFAESYNVQGSSIKYDIALSFAGNDRKSAKKIADELIRNGINVYYDEYEQADLLGKNLYILGKSKGYTNSNANEILYSFFKIVDSRLKGEETAILSQTMAECLKKQFKLAWSPSRLKELYLNKNNINDDEKFILEKIELIEQNCNEMADE